MNKWILCAALLGLALSGCGSSEQCQAFSAGVTLSKCSSLQACCTDTDCRYTAAGGKEWKCNGTDCSSAASTLVAACL